MEAFTDAIGLRALGFRARVIDVLDREIEFVLVPLRIAAVLAAAVGSRTQQLDVMAIEEGNDPVVEQIGRCDRRLAIVELGAGHLGVGVQIEVASGRPARPPSDCRHRTYPEHAVARMLALELAPGFLLSLGLFQRDDLRLGQNSGPAPGRSWLPAP